jgi:hypothetical protein
MSRSAVQSFVVALALAGTMGCQSMPRLAWWKKDKTPDPSAVASATAPALPSTQAKPQAVAGAGIEAAMPPSSANLATAQSAATSATSAVATNAAPAAAIRPAAYPTTATVPTYPMTSAATPGASATAQTGPYDPNSYRPAVPSAATTAGGFSYGTGDRYGATPTAPGADRYGMPPASGALAITPAPTTPTAITPITSAAATSPGSLATTPAAATGDRYGTPPSSDPGSRYATLPAAATAIPTANPLPGSAATAASATTPSTIQLAAPAGQYRPGGTSNYSAIGAAGDHVEIATKPAGTVTPPATVDPAPPATIPAAIIPPMPESAVPGTTIWQ